MGCCNDEKCCESKNAKRRRFSWIGAVAVIIVVLVVTNWK